MPKLQDVHHSKSNDQNARTPWAWPNNHNLHHGIMTLAPFLSPNTKAHLHWSTGNLINIKQCWIQLVIIFKLYIVLRQIQCNCSYFIEVIITSLMHNWGTPELMVLLLQVEKWKHSYINWPSILIVIFLAEDCSYNGICDLCLGIMYCNTLYSKSNYY